jgi:hypothetical protein
MTSRSERSAPFVSRYLTEASRFRRILITDSGDPDHSGDDIAVRPPLTVFNHS